MYISIVRNPHYKNPNDIKERQYHADIVKSSLCISTRLKEKGNSNPTLVGGSFER